MWKTATSALFVLAVGLTGLGPVFGSEDAWSPVEAEMWRLEQSYFQRLQAEDLIGLAEFWHDDFIGWPSHAAEPVDRASSQASVAALFKTTRIVSFEIQPLLIRVFGDVAVVHYLIHLEIETDAGERSSVPYRITHTWLREEGSWRIIGGMSSESRH